MDQGAQGCCYCAEIVPDYAFGLFVAQRLDEYFDVAHVFGHGVLGHIYFVVRGAVPASGSSVASLVERYNMVTGFGNREHHLSPRECKLRIAMAEENEWVLALRRASGF